MMMMMMDKNKCDSLSRFFPNSQGSCPSLRSDRGSCSCSSHAVIVLINWLLWIWTSTTMEMVVGKILCLLGMFGLMLGAILIPVRVMQSDLDKAIRYRRAVAFSNSFGGGVFLATCFNALLPAVRDKVSVRAPRILLFTALQLYLA